MTTEEKNIAIAEILGWKYIRNTGHPSVFPNGVWNDGKVGHPILDFLKI